MKFVPVRRGSGAGQERVCGWGRRAGLGCNLGVLAYGTPAYGDGSYRMGSPCGNAVLSKMRTWALSALFNQS